jgi:5-methylcytosine-specific restriction protein B
VSQVRLSVEPIRSLTAAQVGAKLPDVVRSASSPTISSSDSGWSSLEPLVPDDPILTTTIDLLDRYGGVMFVGPPGTSKSWYAARIAVHLTDGGQPDRLRALQFHPSYQYEDFVEGFVPTSTGFSLEGKHLLQLAKRAVDNPDETHVILIDELSRGEPGRVFGEALTYVEKSKRGLRFHLASGSSAVIPRNLIFLATMNPLDRGVDEVDAAFERRFAKIALDPDEGILAGFLRASMMSGSLAARTIEFFRYVNQLSEQNPMATLGHTYFIGISDLDGLQRLWAHQLRFQFEKAFRLDPEGLAEVRRRWNAVIDLDTGLPKLKSDQ